MNSSIIPETYPDLAPKAKALITNSMGSILLAADQHEVLGLPGGEKDDDETYEDALVRELGEELSLERRDIMQPEYLLTVPHDELHSSWAIYQVDLVNPSAIHKSHEITWLAWMSLATVLSSPQSLVRPSVQKTLRILQRQETSPSQPTVPAMRTQTEYFNRVF